MSHGAFETGAIDRRRLRPINSTRHVEVHETVLRAGVEATVVGHVARRGGTVVLVRRGARLSFARPEPLEEVAARTDEARRDSISATLFLLVLGGLMTGAGIGVVLLFGPPA